MAEITNTIAQFPGVVASVTYDDATFLVLRVGVVNNSAVPVTATVKKLNKPVRTYTHTWLPGASENFSIPPGQCYFTWDAVENNVTMTNLELYVRYG